MALPSNVGYGTVTGTFLQAVADSTDVGREPDGLPVADLQITFTASISPAVVRDATASPPVLIVVQPVDATVDASTGALTGPDGQPGITLIASTDPDLDPHGWTWNVALRSPSFPMLSFSFSLDPGQTIDLATVAQVAASRGASTPSSGSVIVDNGDGTLSSF